VAEGEHEYQASNGDYRFGVLLILVAKVPVEFLGNFSVLVDFS